MILKENTVSLRGKDGIKNGNDLSMYMEKINSGSIIPLVKDFMPDRIDAEIKLREILLQEGNSSLSSAIALTQYYNRRGLKLKYQYTAEDIAKIKDAFKNFPEISIASWRMNGKNYKLIDANATESLKKNINRRSWTTTKENSSKEKYYVDKDFSFYVTLPAGWQRVEEEIQNTPFSLTIESPYKDSKIIVQAIQYKDGNIKAIADEWSKSKGFDPVAKEWGKQKDFDYLVSISKNRYNGVMESYIIKKDNYALLISGITERGKYSLMNRCLKDIFTSIDF